MALSTATQQAMFQNWWKVDNAGSYIRVPANPLHAVYIVKLKNNSLHKLNLNTKSNLRDNAQLFHSVKITHEHLDSLFGSRKVVRRFVVLE